MKNTRRERFLEYLELVGSATATNTAVTTEENTNEIENPMHENNQQDDNTLEDTVKQFFQEPIESFQRNNCISLSPRVIYNYGAG